MDFVLRFASSESLGHPWFGPVFKLKGLSESSAARRCTDSREREKAALSPEIYVRCAVSVPDTSGEGGFPHGSPGSPDTPTGPVRPKVS